MLSRRAFTLVELLVVISIIVVLMSLIMGGVMVAKRAAMRSKAQTQIGNLAAAVETYNGLNGCYPEKWKVPAATDPDLIAAGTALVANGYAMPGVTQGNDIYEFVFSTAFGTSGAPAKAIGALIVPTANSDVWAPINAVLVRQLMSIDASLGQKGNGLILDPWNKPLRYRPSKWYPMSGAVGSTPRVDAEDAPNPASFQIWSSGGDLKDEAANPGEAGDDLSNWPRKN